MALFWNLLSLIGGLSLFLFGMTVMGRSLEKRAGERLRSLLARLTAGKLRALLLGAVVTALLQSSSAVMVMAVGFVNAGLLSLSQVIGIVMGANIGTTLTAWLISLTQLEGDSFLMQMLKPSSFTPILSLIGIVFFLFSKQEKRRLTGEILLGFAVLIYGMEAMSAAVEPLAELPAFGEVLLVFQNPILGVLAGAILTAVIQSSSASIGILQALSVTGKLTVGAAIPIIMGQNIGTCVTALLASIGTGRNGRRAAMIHLYFNVIGTAVLLTAYSILQAGIDLTFAREAIGAAGIAAIHSIFNLACTLLLFPFSGFLEKLAMRTVPERRAEAAK